VTFFRYAAPITDDARGSAPAPGILGGMARCPNPPEKQPLKGYFRGLCASAHRRSDYSSSGCVPAVPDSASSDIRIIQGADATGARRLTRSEVAITDSYVENGPLEWTGT